MALNLLIRNEFLSHQPAGSPLFVEGDGIAVYDTGVASPPATMRARAVLTEATLIDGDPAHATRLGAAHQYIADPWASPKAFVVDETFNPSL
jgi:hypothetical protein